jgi:hypothetical protein
MTPRVISATSLRKITCPESPAASAMLPMAATESTCPVGLICTRCAPISRSPAGVMMFCCCSAW